MTGFDDDRELDDFLARRSMLHRRLADRDRTDPPPELDRLVLGKAREAIDVEGSAPVYRAPRWALPVALAATVVLAFAIVLNVGRLPGGGIPISTTATPSAEMAPSAALADNSARQVDEQFAAERDSGEKFAPEPAPAIPSRDLARNQARASDVALAKARTAAAPAPSGASAPPAAAVVMPRAVAEASEHENLTASTTPQSPPLVANTGARAYAPPPAETRAIVPAKGEMGVSNAPLDSIAVTAARRTRSEHGADSAIAVTSVPQPMATTEALASGAAAPLAPEAKRASPRAWMDEIIALRAAGKTAAADRELEEFRKVFPEEAAKFLARDPRPAQ